MQPTIYNLDYVKEQSKKDLFNVVSLFAGAGGSSTGYRLAGGKVLAINEFIKEAQRVYSVNYPDTYIFKQDVRKLTGAMILEKISLKVGELDILDGSPPCASFSMAGNRSADWGKIKKYSDSIQRTDDLFFEYARLVKELQPKVFIAENVKGLTTGEASTLLGSEQMGLFGEHENTIYYALTKAGYNVRYKVLNAKHYGVPQARERVIFIGVRKDIDKIITYPKKCKEYVSVKEAIDDLKNDIKEDKVWNQKDTMIKKLHPLVEEGDSFELVYEKIYGKKSWFSVIKIDRNKPCNTILTNYGNLQHYTENRMLTIAEVIRLSGFPEDFYTGEVYSKRYERIGRAVPPLMMRDVAKHVYNTILK